MKTKIFIIALFASLTNGIFAQDRTTVTATSNDISDNLDLKAVASIFGDSENLEDFERRLNDPKMQISNLDLNGDNQVDYLRVIESVEGNTHLIIIQAVLEKDVFQDVATVEVERDGNNNVQVQVVGDVYMYGNNYIYEPVYVSRPIIYDYFWIGGYHPYHSAWYWGYYPSYYHVWHPYPVYRYRRNVNVYINVHNHYNYVNTRRSTRAAALYNTRRSNGYEVRHPERSFTQRNAGVTNRHELVQTRRNENSGTRTNTGNVRSSATTRSNAGVRTSTPSTTRGNAPVRTSTATSPVRTSGTRSATSAGTTRSNSNTRTGSGNTRSNEGIRSSSGNVRASTPVNPAVNSATRSQSTTRPSSPARSAAPTVSTRPESPRVNAQPQPSRQPAPQRSQAPQQNDSQRGGRR